MARSQTIWDTINHVNNSVFERLMFLYNQINVKKIIGCWDHENEIENPIKS